MTGQHLWVILCCLPEKGRKEIEEIVGDEREGSGRKREMKESEGTEEITTSPLYPYLLQGQRPCPTVSQYQLDAPVTKATGQLHLTQPPLLSGSI